MDLIDQVHLEATPARRVLHVLQQLAGILNLGAGGGIDLDQVHEAAGVDFPTGGALPARRGGHTDLAVQRLGENPGDGGFAHPARTGEQKSVMQPLPVERVSQRTDHMLLADQFVKGAGAPFAGQNLIAHEAPPMATKAVSLPSSLTHAS